jgi:hypothetical protein
LNSKRVELLDHPRLLAQLGTLERRTARGGKDSIDHQPGAHDDLANAACGALVLVGVNAHKPIALSDDFTTQAAQEQTWRERNAGFLKYLSGKASHGLGDE